MKSRMSLNNIDDYLNVVRLHCQLLPEYTPQKFDWSEPIKQTFNSVDLTGLIPKSGNVDNVWWKRMDKPKATGNWMKSGVRAGSKSEFTHSDISLHVLDTSFQNKLIDYLKISSIKSEVDIGFIDSVADEYRNTATLNGYAPYGGDLRLTTKQLRNWLPEMPWAVVFGPIYVSMFSMRNILTTPAHVVEELEDGSVYIQLTPFMSDIHERYQEVIQAREAAKKHLGKKYFFEPTLAYNFNSEPGKAGKIFQVPEFDFAAS